MDRKNNTGKLGKGLGALLGDNQYSVLAANSAARVKSDSNTKIHIDKIEVNPGQPRVDFDETALNELAQSIKTYGLIQPITVRPIANGRYQIISGERRWRASKLAGLTEIPAFVRSVDEVMSIQMALVENIQREDLNAIEVAVSFRRLLDECDLSQDDLCAKVGKDKTTIVNYLRLLKLSTEVQIAVRDSRISMSHARSIAGFDDPDIQNRMLNEILAKGLSVRDTELLAKNLSAKVKPKKSPSRMKLSNELQQVRKDLSARFDTKVGITRNPSGKGKVTIPFDSDEQLQKVIKMLSAVK